MSLKEHCLMFIFYFRIKLVYTPKQFKKEKSKQSINNTKSQAIHHRLTQYFDSAEYIPIDDCASMYI